MAESVIDCWKKTVNLREPLVNGERFLVKLAENESEKQQAQRLRYDVFMAEQGRLNGDGGVVLDCDAYDDDGCLHLLVVEKANCSVVGTYRVRPGILARRGNGFYSERQYRIRGLAALADDTCEVGRSCVACDHRNGAVVALLWAGFSELRKRLHFRFLIGCASLENVDPAIGWGMYAKFKHDGMLSDLVDCVPRSGFELPPAEVPETDAAVLRREMPPLLKGYIRLGAKIGGLPAFDPEFGSIDFLILFDFERIPERYSRHFAVE